MLTQFRKYREQQAKAAGAKTDDSTVRRLTKAEVLVSTLGNLDRKIADLDFPICQGSFYILISWRIFSIVSSQMLGGP